MSSPRYNSNGCYGTLIDPNPTYYGRSRNYSVRFEDYNDSTSTSSGSKSSGIRKQKEKHSTRSPDHRRVRKQDRVIHKIPDGYCTANWNPEEEPILIAGSVFDTFSLGKWIYDWTSHCYNIDSTELDMAEQLWYSILGLSGILKSAKIMLNAYTKLDYIDMIHDFIESGNNLVTEFRAILRQCTKHMLTAKKKGNTVEYTGGIKFVACLLDVNYYIVEKFVNSTNVWIARFERNINEH